MSKNRKDLFYCRKDPEKAKFGYYIVFFRDERGIDHEAAHARLRYTDLNPWGRTYFSFYQINPDYVNKEGEIINVLHKKMGTGVAQGVENLDGIGFHICKENSRFKVYDCSSDGSYKEAASLEYNQRSGKCYAKITPDYAEKSTEILCFIAREFGTTREIIPIQE